MYGSWMDDDNWINKLKFDFEANKEKNSNK